MAPCGSCGSTRPQEFIHTDPKSGRQTSYPTRMQAEAAKIRAGGGNIRIEEK